MEGKDIKIQIEEEKRESESGGEIHRRYLRQKEEKTEKRDEKMEKRFR